MWMSRKKFDEVAKKVYEEGYKQGYLQGQVQAFKEIRYCWRILDGEPGILADQIEEILRKKGFVQ